MTRTIPARRRSIRTVIAVGTALMIGGSLAARSSGSATSDADTLILFSYRLLREGLTVGAVR